MMSNSEAFAGTDREWDALILSQESARLLEVTRAGDIVGSLSLDTLGLPGSDSIEGVTMDGLGRIYLVAEGAKKSDPSWLYVLSVPEPSTAGLAGAGIAGIAWLCRRGNKKEGGRNGASLPRLPGTGL